MQEHGGGGGIRTHGRVTPTTVFKTAAFNRSATPPARATMLPEPSLKNQENPPLTVCPCGFGIIAQDRFQEEPVEKLKVLFHVNEPDRWKVALGNITNLIKDVGSEAVDVVLIANGQGISAYAEADKVETMSGLVAQGVQFCACNNSLKMMCDAGNVCMRHESLPSFVTVVPAGITAIVKKQQEGYAYVKP